MQTNNISIWRIALTNPCHALDVLDVLDPRMSWRSGSKEHNDLIVMSPKGHSGSLPCISWRKAEHSFHGIWLYECHRTSQDETKTSLVWRNPFCHFPGKLPENCYGHFVTSAQQAEINNREALSCSSSITLRVNPFFMEELEPFSTDLQLSIGRVIKSFIPGHLIIFATKLRVTGIIQDRGVRCLV